MDNCIFCQKLNTTPEAVFTEDETGQFAVLFDQFPVRPGHTLIIPKRHVQHFEDLTHDELTVLAPFVAKMKGEIRQLDLKKLYDGMQPANEKSSNLIKNAQQLLVEMNRPLDDFNDGLNDGAAGGQTVPHLHWHIIPRWEGDMPDARGGIRNMFGESLGQYFK